MKHYTFATDWKMQYEELWKDYTAVQTQLGETTVQLIHTQHALAAREQTLADVAELATQVVQSLTNYREAYALVRQMRAVLKKAREA